MLIFGLITKDDSSVEKIKHYASIKDLAKDIPMGKWVKIISVPVLGRPDDYLS